MRRYIEIFRTNANYNEGNENCSRSGGGGGAKSVGDMRGKIEEIALAIDKMNRNQRGQISC